MLPSLKVCLFLPLHFVSPSLFLSFSSLPPFPSCYLSIQATVEGSNSQLFLFPHCLLLPLHSVVLLLLPVSQSDAVVRRSTAGSCDRQAGPVRSWAAINKELAATAAVAAVGEKGWTETHSLSKFFLQTSVPQCLIRQNCMITVM